LFLEELFQIATIDKNYSKAEDNFLKIIAEIFNINERWFNHLKNKHVKSEEDFSVEYEYFYNTFFSQSTNNKSEQAYKILKCSPNDDIETIKKAYRKLAKENHPDKVMHLGDENVKKANDIFAEITNAYDIILKEKE